MSNLDWLDRYISTKTHYQEKDKYLKDNGYSSVLELEADNEKIEKDNYRNSKYDFSEFDKIDMKNKTLVIYGEEDLEEREALKKHFPNTKIVYRVYGK
jgi:hypothetical protein